MLGSFGQLVISVLCLSVLYKGHKVPMSAICPLQDDKGPSEEERRRMSLEEVSEGERSCLPKQGAGYRSTMEWRNTSMYSVIGRHCSLFSQTRKSLPIYPYRDALLEAIKEHQVPSTIRLTAVLGHCCWVSLVG